MPHPCQYIRSHFLAFAHYSLASLAAIGLVCWPSPGRAYDESGFLPQIVLIVDESGSMTGQHAWLADFVPALSQALTQHNEYDSPIDIVFTVAGFAENTRNLVVHGSENDATDAISRLSTDKNGIEDGYLAIHEVLEGSGYHYAPPTTIILITDEDRDVTDPDVTLVNLGEYLVSNGIVVHSIVPAEILCPGRKWGIAIDQYRVALLPAVGGLASCEDADSWIQPDYAELAWTTGGLTWNLETVAPEWRKQASTVELEQFVAGLSDKIFTQWPKTLSARIEFSPAKPRPGDVVTFDASGSIANQQGREVSSWAWDLDGDRVADEEGPTITRIFSSGRHSIALEVTDNSTPPATSRKVIYLQVSD